MVRFCKRTCFLQWLSLVFLSTRTGRQGNILKKKATLPQNSVMCNPIIQWLPILKEMQCLTSLTTSPKSPAQTLPKTTGQQSTLTSLTSSKSSAQTLPKTTGQKSSLVLVGMLRLKTRPAMGILFGGMRVMTECFIRMVVLGVLELQIPYLTNCVASFNHQK